MTRVLIADDHPIVCEGVRRVLQKAPEMVVVAEVGNSADVVPTVTKLKVDVVILDIAMPGPDFLEVLSGLRTSAPACRTIMLSGFPEEEYAIRALRAGAVGYVSKRHGLQDVLEAVARAAAGRRFLSPALAERLAFGVSPDAHQPLHERLSDREFEVLRLMASGKSLKEIAAALDISPKTVSTFRARLLEKLGVKTNADLVKYALRHELI